MISDQSESPSVGMMTKIFSLIILLHLAIFANGKGEIISNCIIFANNIRLVSPNNDGINPFNQAQTYKLRSIENELLSKRAVRGEASLISQHLPEYIYKRILKRSWTQPPEFIYKRIL